MLPTRPIHSPSPEAAAAAGPRETRPYHRTRSVATVLAAAVLIGLAGSACGGSADAISAPSAGNGGNGGATTVPAEATATPKPTPSTATVDVGADAWFAGFHVTFGTATAELQVGRGGTVTIEAVFENTGDDDARLDATLDLAYAGEHASEAMEMDIPSVPGGATSKGTFAFGVEDTFTFDDAVLTLGRSGNQRAIVPLTAAAGEAVALEPTDVAVGGTGTAGDLRIELKDGGYRADQPWSHGQMEAGSLVLTLGYDATFRSDFAGGFAFTGENVALRLPDGTVVGVIQDGRSQSIELIGPSSTVKDLFSRFEIEDPAQGDYAFLVRSFDNAEDEIPFSIP